MGQQGQWGPRRLPGGGVAAAGVGKRRQGYCRSKGADVRHVPLCIFLPSPDDPHISLHDSQPQTSMAPSHLPHLRVPVLTRPLINCVILGMSPPRPASVSSSVKQDGHFFPTSWIWFKNLKKGTAVPMLLVASNRNTQVNSLQH